MKKNGFLPLAAGFLLFAVLFLFTQPFSEGFANGLQSCARIVIPSMFPFLVSSSLAGSGHLPDRLKRIFEPITQLLFRLPADCLPAIIIGQLGGYLSGAKAADSLCQSGIISPSQGSRLMLFSVNAGMGFAVNAVGSMMLGSRQLGRILLFSLCVSSLITGFFCRFIPEKENITVPRKKVIPFSTALVNSITSGTNAMLAACGFICIFSGIMSVIGSYIPDKTILSFVSCLLEITNGCIIAADSFSVPFIAAFCAFGGICVHLQIFAVTKSFSVSILKFCLFRILHAVLAYAICAVFLHFFPVEQQVFLSVSENAALWSFSAPSAVSLLFLSALLILDLDNTCKL